MRVFAQLTALPNGLQWLSVEFCLSSLYVNTLLANLNARTYLRKTDLQYNSYDMGQAELSTFAARPGNSTGGSTTHVARSEVRLRHDILCA